MIVQFCGLSGAGKTTIAYRLKSKFTQIGKSLEVIDGDEYRSNLFKELSFSREDRNENIRRLGFIANKFSQHGIITVICAINPYEHVRNELKEKYNIVKTVFIYCPINILVARDTKGLYSRANLPDCHPDKIWNLTGVNAPFETPEAPDLYINTSISTIDTCTAQLFDFIINQEDTLEYQKNMRSLK